MSYIEVTDQTGRNVKLKQSSQRIVSLVPSQTELLSDLGLDKQLVGITKFCVHPNHVFRSKTRVGGTKNVHLDVIDALSPDLIIANKEENVKAQVEALSEKYPVWVSDVHDLDSALEMIESVGELTDRAAGANQICAEIRSEFEALSAKKKGKVAYLIWYQPLMTVGNDTFIHDLLNRSGFENVFSDQIRYPETNFEALRELKPDLIFLSSEPFPFKEKHLKEFREKLPGKKVILVDGEYFSWYGSRLIKAADYLKKLKV